MEGATENGYAVFKLSINPETGSLISNEHLFSFESKNIDKIVRASSPNNSNLVDSKFDCWKIVSIENNGERVEIDSCLMYYNLGLFHSNKLSQSYKSELNCGLYFEERIKY